MNEPTQVKIKCENWYWSRLVQILLNKKFNINWDRHRAEQEFKPWNIRRPYLMLVQNPFNKSWWFAWGNDYDAEHCPFTEVSAKELVKQLQK